MTRAGLFARTAGAGLFAACLTFAALPAAAQPMTIRFATAGIGGDLPVEMMYIFKEWVDRSAPGEFDIQIHHSGTLIRAGTEIVALQRGSTEMTILSWWDIADRIPEYSILTVGYLFRDWPHVQSFMDGPLGEAYFARIRDELQVHILDYYYAGARIVNLREPREVRVPADLEGVKLRMPGSPAFLLLGEALGADAVPLALPDVYLGLETGTVDGQDNPLSTTYRARFHEVTGQVILTYHSIPANMLAISEATWEQLTPRQQGIFEDAARAAMTFNDTNKFRDDEVLIGLLQEAGLVVTEPDRDAFRTHVLQVFRDEGYMDNAPEGWLEAIEAAGAQ